jgi:alpha-N-arabinofuranosidase
MKTNTIIGALLLSILAVTTGAQTPPASTLQLQLDKATVTISKDIYGHFAEHLGHCIYEGIWVGEGSAIPNTRGLRNDVVAALKDLSIPVLRWPGGCFADTYHWKDGIGPREKRPSIINVHWGGVTEDNSFGTHEFMDLCETLGCDAYVSANLGSGTVQEMSEWVEYLTSDADSPMTRLRKQNGREKPWTVKYLGVGNESWGCGGNMIPEYYANLMRQYSSFCRDFAGNRLYKVACGANADDYNWTDVVMKNGGGQMHGISLHYYTLPTGDWGHKGSATQFGEADWFAVMNATLHMEPLIGKQLAVMDRHDPQHRIGLIVDEWGTWYDVEPGTNPGFLYQQNTLRDAVAAAINLNLFNNHADRVRMANIAQTINVLQAMVLTRKEQMVLTPSYHVFRMFKVHQNARLIPGALKCPEYSFNGKSVPSLSASASRDAAGIVHVTVANLDPKTSNELAIDLGTDKPAAVTAEVLTSAAMNDFNDFGAPPKVMPVKFEQFKRDGTRLMVTLPSKSVVGLEIKFQ